MTGEFLVHVLSFSFSQKLLFQIRWEDRLVNDNGRACKISIDGTDFRTQEYDGFDPERLSHKYNKAALRYEVGIAIKTGHIVHINGPFKAGAWSDLRIARNYLHKILPKGEYYIADGGYKGDHVPSVLYEDVPEEEKRRFKKIRARHENVNGRFKEWRILSDAFRHEEEKHGLVFHAVAVLTQLEMETVRPIWRIAGI